MGHEEWIEGDEKEACQGGQGAHQTPGVEKSEDEALLNALISTDIDTWKQLSDIEREQNIHKIRKLLEQSDYNTDWDSEDLLSLDELNRNDDF